MIKVNALGDACPIPVVKTKKAIAELNGPGQVEVLVDNEIAVQNLTKMANQKGYEIRSEKLEEQKFAVVLTIGEGAVDEPKTEQEEAACQPDKRNNTVVVCSSSRMGEGNEGLGSVLMKGFIYALTQLDELPATMIFYNGGAALTCEEAPTLEDLKSLEAQGVEILTCGTCLNYYGLTEKLAVGEVTNMYTIAEKLSQASKIIRP